MPGGRLALAVNSRRGLWNLRRDAGVTQWRLTPDLSTEKKPIHGQFAYNGAQSRPQLEFDSEER